MAHIGRLIVVGLALTGCGAARVGQAAQPVKGTVRYCAIEPGERAAAKAFDHAHARQGLSVHLRVLTSGKRLVAALKGGQCDVAELAGYDVPRLAAAGTIRDLSAYIRGRRKEFVPASLHSGHYAKRDWAVPMYLDVGLLWSHTYALPKTLQQLYLRGGFVFGDGPDTALAFLETACAAGGSVLSPDGRHSALDSRQNRAALALMREAVVRGTVRAATGDDAYRSFARGGARFMRNWATLTVRNAAFRGRRETNLSPLPPFAGGRPATLMVGMDLTVTRSARNVRAALAFIDGRTSVAGERPGAGVGYLPALVRSYDDYERQNVVAGPFVMRALRHAVSLPVTPHLSAITSVIGYAVHAAIAGRMSVARALHEGSRAIDQILANGAPGGEA